jgi:hypothetical protein
MEQLSDFYELMAQTATIRRDLVNYYLIDVAKPSRLEALRKARSRLAEAPTDDQGRLLLSDEQGHRIPVNADYELLELDKDLTFFGEGEAAFASYLGSIHPRFGEETKELVDFLRRAGAADGGAKQPAAKGAGRGRSPHPFSFFITDRDGTVNNYCARYRSSVQSAYNAVFLSRFASTLAERPIILTSAPLQDIGIVDLSVMPENTYVLAGSKGREYRDISGERRADELAEREREQLAELNRRLKELLDREENRVFGFIGSSLQKKHGETTVARQDVNSSIPAEESERFRREVEEIVEELNDGDAASFHIDDTGKDLEIILQSGAGGGTGTSAAQARHFDKGDGVAFLAGRLGRRLAGTQLLICGDTSSDVPMVRRAVEAGAEVSTVFVTSDSELQHAVRETGARAHFASTPDVLVAALDLAAKGDEG